ncbi:hypothetical protein MTR67_038702, partial [Solanum verrucosum]
MNSLDGVIPPNLEKCRKLQVLALSFNEFIGTLPRELANLTLPTKLSIPALHLEALQLLGLHLNKLSGTLPPDLGHGTPILEEFLCGENNLSDFISASISNSSRLRVLDLSGNSFTGPIPESL